jgi:hypothetical protein
MKNRSRVSIVLIILGCLMIGVGLVSSLIVNVKEDQEATKQRMVDVTDVYKKFSENVDNFNDLRNDLYLTYFDQLYYDTLSQIDANVQQALSDYEVVVDDVSKSANNMKSMCGDINFTDTSTSNKCSSYGSVYEQIVNAFVSDVKLYNKSVESYNKYQEELNSGLSLNKYKTSKKFIDYNNDKKYDGKEE